MEKILTFVSPYLNNAYAVLMVVFGLGFVIFIHELGHFLLAKWAGVKVEMFSIGFGPTLVSWRKGIGLRFGSSVKDLQAMQKADVEGGPAKDVSSIGETEYSIRALPLGGFVKMLGEDAGDVEAKTSDPRAYHNKPVGSRMAIISAGVIMNLIFGVSCATWFYMRAHPEQPAVVGSVVAGQPAYEAGIRPGDEIVGIDGRDDIAFKDLLQSVMLSGTGHSIQFDIKRPGERELIHLLIEPRRAAKAPAPTIGIRPAQSLEFWPDPPKPNEADEDALERITAAGPKGAPPIQVADIEALNAILARYRDKPLEVLAARGMNDGKAAKQAKPIAHDFPPKPFVDFGLRLTLGPVAAIRDGSPASKAGFRPGDQIISVNGKSELDPMRLPDLVYENTGKPISFQVRRAAGGKDTTVTLTATPEDVPVWTEPVESAEPLDLSGLGLAVAIEPKVAAVVPGSPAELAGISPGTTIKSVQFAEPKKKGAWLKPITLDSTGSAWPWIFGEIQEFDGSVRFELARGAVMLKPIELKPVPVAGWFNPIRGLHFAGLRRQLPPQPLATALRKGWRDSQDVALSIFGIIRGLFQQRVDPNLVGGPVKIGEWAFKVARSGGLGAFIPFLGILSINLAVINFLPIPPLDGGQMTFLIAEKIRGRPLPENAVLYPTLVGVAFVLTLFAFIFLKDIISYF